eukprot:163346-Chlamydomonas_euryale.AAC.2
MQSPHAKSPCEAPMQIPHPRPVLRRRHRSHHKRTAHTTEVPHTQQRHRTHNRGTAHTAEAPHTQQRHRTHNRGAAHTAETPQAIHHSTNSAASRATDLQVLPLVGEDALAQLLLHRRLVAHHDLHGTQTHTYTHTAKRTVRSTP